MRFILAIAAAAATLAPSFVVPAAESVEPKLSAAYDQCTSKAESNTVSLMACESQEWERQDKRLNAAYQALLSKVSTPKGEELRKVQRAWLAYTEAKCGFLYDNEQFSGSLDRLVASHCSVVERTRRADELEILAKH